MTWSTKCGVVADKEQVGSDSQVQHQSEVGVVVMEVCAQVGNSYKVRQCQEECSASGYNTRAVFISTAVSVNRIE